MNGNLYKYLCKYPECKKRRRETILIFGAAISPLVLFVVLFLAEAIELKEIIIFLAISLINLFPLWIMGTINLKAYFKLLKRKRFELTNTDFSRQLKTVNEKLKKAPDDKILQELKDELEISNYMAYIAREEVALGPPLKMEKKGWLREKIDEIASGWQRFKGLFNKKNRVPDYTKNDEEDLF